MTDSFLKENHINLKRYQLSLNITANLMCYHAKFNTNYNLKKLAKQANISVLAVQRCLAGISHNISDYYTINNILIQKLNY